MRDKPKCIIVTGRPGSGKSTLTVELGKLLYLPVIGRDAIKEGYVNTFAVRHDALPPDSNEHATETFFDTITLLLTRKISVIVEAAFQHRVWQPRLENLTTIARVYFIICSVDSAVAGRRCLERGVNDPKREFYHGDKWVMEYREHGAIGPEGAYDPPLFDLPTINVSTLDGYSPSMDTLLNFIAASTQT